MRLVAEIALVAVAAAAIAVCLRALPARAMPRWRPASVVPPPRPDQLTELERLVSRSTADAVTVHAYLRPVLTEIASRRLVAHGYALDQMPATAGRELLGEQLWEIVAPGRPFPQDRYGPGVTLGELRAMLDVLQAL
jgi:hypothetical protein